MLANLTSAQLHSAKKAFSFTLAAMAFAFVASSANAAECVGGYRTLESDLVIPCRDGALAVLPDIANEPQFTGSIEPRGTVVRAARTGNLMVSTPEECFPGAYRTIQHDSSVTPVPCR